MPKTLTDADLAAIAQFKFGNLMWHDLDAFPRAQLRLTYEYRRAWRRHGRHGNPRPGWQRPTHY